MKHLMVKKKKQTLLLPMISVMVIIGIATVFFLFQANKTFTIIQSVRLLSGNKSYDDKVEGAWKLEKTAKWIDFHKAQIQFTFDSIVKPSKTYQDILFVIDVSSGMQGDRIDRVKSDSKELVKSVLSNSNNRVGVITFDTSSQVLLNLTSNQQQVLTAIDGLTSNGNTNYYQALVNVETVLKKYQKEDDRDFIVLFLTGGYPNVDTPSQNGQYTSLKDNYPYTNIIGVQYGMGSNILDPVIKISDKQYIADMETSNNVLLEAAGEGKYFEKIEIVDYIDNEDFSVESEDDILPSVGTIKLVDENGKQKVVWTIGENGLRTGRGATLTIDVVQKKESYNDQWVTTNVKEEVTVQIEGEEEYQETTIKPTLKNKYQVIYDGNNLSGCNMLGVPTSKSYSPYEKVTIENNISCKGYNFKEWKITTPNVEKISNNVFIMPYRDVVLKATWGKMTAGKSMNGEVSTVRKLTEYLMSRANNISIASYEDGDNAEMYTFRHHSTMQTNLLNDYRYIGKKPNNYVYFNCKGEGSNNCEIWRIIGVFQVEGADGRKENRVKLIRDRGIGNYAWNINYFNEWSESSLNTYLNDEYYNSLSSSARSMIGDAKYYLGGSLVYSDLRGTDYYSFERGTDTYCSLNRNSAVCRNTLGNANWIGKIALMYPSDYVYTYALGADPTNLCFENAFSCNLGSPTEGWIYNSNINDRETNRSTQWLLSPLLTYSYKAFYVLSSGGVTTYGLYVSDSYGVRPVVYLTSDVYKLDGDGSINHPYVIGKLA